jgi:GNAT superfamily N-acetyltransferase
VALYPRVMRLLARRAGFRLFRFFARPLGGEPSSSSMQILAEDAAAALCADDSLDLKEDAVRAAYAKGDLCVATFDGAAVAGYCWLGFSPVHHLDGVWVETAPSVAWVYKSLVRDAYRGRGIAPALYRFADAACRERGRTTSVVCIEDHNAPSARAALNAGYAHAGYAAWLRGRSGLRAWYSAAVRPLGVRYFLPAP